MTTKEMVVRLCSGNLRQLSGNAEWFNAHDEEELRKSIEEVFVIADMINEVNNSRLLNKNEEELV